MKIKKTFKFFRILTFLIGSSAIISCANDEAINYIVTFNPNNGNSIVSVKVESGTAISIPADLNPTKAGFVFDGWYKDAETLIVFDFATEKITQNTTLYAKWKAVNFQVTYNSNNGSSIASVNVESGKTISKPADPTKAGFVFDGWYKDAEALIVFDFATEKITQNTTLYAKWAVTITFESIYLEVVPAEMVDVPTIKTDIGIGVNLPVPTQRGWTFDGWYKDPYCTIKAITDGGLLFKTSTNISLYACWRHLN